MDSSSACGSNLLVQYREVRARSEHICEPLAIEDYGIQPMPDASPPKWHLAHTTWFFEKFVLSAFVSDYQTFHPKFNFLFNSYYESVGLRHPRPERGNLSRPTVSEIKSYRKHVDSAMASYFEHSMSAEVAARVILGIHHEQQHQELMYTDLKYNFGHNPLFPVYKATTTQPDVTNDSTIPQLEYHTFEGGKVPVGATAEGSFCFDNETPQHYVWLEPFGFANRLVTNHEYVEFINDDGYANPNLWLSDGWRECVQRQWRTPEYWCLDENEGWCEYTLAGLQPIDWNAPVTHVSLYEADAFARWAQRRLPTEFEWETVANLARKTESKQPRPPLASSDTQAHHPQPAMADGTIEQMIGHCWQWTASAYTPYPGYTPLAGALGEYNGKFMANQFVLRGGSCVTPSDHIRTTYRNFFYPKDRWQFTGIRLASNRA